MWVPYTRPDMSKSFERYQKRKLISSYFSVTLSIALVLFLMGILGLLVLNTRKLADHFKEQITISVFFKDSAKQVEIDQLQKSLVMASYTKSAVFVSKDEAAAQHSEEIGENFMDFLGYNPLKNSIDVQLNADFVSPVQIDSIATDIGKRSFVEEVSYDRPTIALLTENVRRIGLGILVASALFTLIDMTLAWVLLAGFAPINSGAAIGSLGFALLVMGDVWRSLGVAGFTLVLVGGALYTFGAVIYAFRRPDPWPRVFGYHELFHLLVIGGATLHYVSVAFIVLPKA